MKKTLTIAISLIVTLIATLLIAYFCWLPKSGLVDFIDVPFIESEPAWKSKDGELRDVPFMKVEVIPAQDNAEKLESVPFIKVEQIPVQGAPASTDTP